MARPSGVVRRGEIVTAAQSWVLLWVFPELPSQSWG